MVVTSWGILLTPGSSLTYSLVVASESASTANDVSSWALDSVCVTFETAVVACSAVVICLRVSSWGIWIARVLSGLVRRMGILLSVLVRKLGILLARGVR